MPKSNTKIKKQTERKTNSELVETIKLANKHSNWKVVAEILSGPRKNRINLNLNELNKKIDENKKVVVIGKVLSQGEIEKKIKIAALGFSEKAKDKLLKAGCEVSLISEEIKKNPEAKDIEVIRK